MQVGRPIAVQDEPRDQSRRNASAAAQCDQEPAEPAAASPVRTETFKCTLGRRRIARLKLANVIKQRPELLGRPELTRRDRPGQALDLFMLALHPKAGL